MQHAAYKMAERRPILLHLLMYRGWYTHCHCGASAERTFRVPRQSGGPRRGGATVSVLGLLRSNFVMLLLVLSTALMFATVLVFLIAAWTLRRANDRKAARWAAVETRWHALLTTIEEGTLAAEELHAHVASNERLVLVDFLYKQVINDPRPATQQLCRQLAAPYLAELAERIRTGDAWQRARAVRTLAELAGPEQGEAIIDALDDPSVHVAQTAARSYARLSLGPVEPLLKRLDR